MLPEDAPRGRPVSLCARRQAGHLAILFLLAISAGLAGWLLPARMAPAEVRRCQLPEGGTVYTDRRCADIGAVERIARHAGTATVSRLYRGGCARTLQDLVYEMTSAIDAGDVNRMAAVYHWPGISARGAVSIMQRLDAVVQRPLVDILAITPPGPEGEDGSYYPQTTVRARPIGLRLQQTLANGSTPSQTVFALRRHVGCWWVRL